MRKIALNLNSAAVTIEVVVLNQTRCTGGSIIINPNTTVIVVSIFAMQPVACDLEFIGIVEINCLELIADDVVA